MSTTPPIRVLIVDDEPLARTAIRLLLETDAEVEVAGECGDGSTAVEAIRDGNIDIVFLDVQMPTMSGLDVIGAIGASTMPLVVFATAFDEYAVAAFDAHALDYLLKPFDDTRFRQSLERAKQHFRQRAAAKVGEQMAALIGHTEGAGAEFEPPAPGRTPRLRLKTPGRLVLLDPVDIDHVEAADYCIRIHAGGNVHLVRDSMQAMEQRLDPNLFVRIHRSSIVNVERIREVQPLYHGDFVVILHDGSQHRLSRSRRKALEARLGKLA